MDLVKFQREVQFWSKKNFPKGKKYQPLLGATEELGELCHIHLKTEQGIRGYDSQEKSVSEKLDAIGDIVIYLADYCARNGLSLKKAIGSTWLRVQARDWVKNKLEGVVNGKTDN
jgi:NTP pyrophosphatase (non-canonical NTP hydrolase)